MSRASLADLFPDLETLLELEPAELGAAVLELWPRHCGNNTDKTTLSTFYERVYGVQSSNSYANSHDKQQAFTLALAEAWAWLERELLIMPDPHAQPGSWYLRTRRGKTLKSRTDVEAYRQAGLLPRQLLHPTIEHKAWPPFQRGEYETAVLQAFIAVELAVRRAADLPDDLLGVKLMRKAFHAESGPLTDMSVLVAERQATLELFAGAIGHAKNPHSHREKPVRIDEAARLLLFASYLLQIVDVREMLS